MDNDSIMFEDKNKAVLQNYALALEGENQGQEIVFYKLNEDGSHENGTTVEELLRVGISRLESLNARFYSRENDIAVYKMKEALMWLNKRTEDRKARGVEGKHLP